MSFPCTLFSLVLLSFLLLSGCQTRKTNDLSLTKVSFETIPGYQNDQIVDAVPALKRSCAVMLKQPSKTYSVPETTNLSGTYKDWNPFCTAVMREQSSSTTQWKSILQAHLTPYRLSLDGRQEGQFTGYYEPLLHGSKRKHGRYKFPLYRYPSAEEAKRINVKIPRSDIVRGALAGRGLELLWVDSPVDAFFVQIQGSGRVKLDTGKMINIGYAGQNGHPYHPIGKTLVQNGELTLKNATMQSIRHWLKTHPKRAEEIMSTNHSYVFFRIIDGTDGPIGSQGVPLTAKRSIAVDPAYIGLGSPMWVDIEHPDINHPSKHHHKKTHLQHLAIAQDTGGAIKGGLRADYFWGFGAEATDLSGRMNSKGKLYLLLPKN